MLLAVSLTAGYSQSFNVPGITNHVPQAGMRVKVVPIEYKNTDVYYSLYLPKNYKKGNKHPVIVEYPGNEWKQAGSTGLVRFVDLGFSIAEKIEAIWVVFPYIEDSIPITKWWGKKEETVEFALSNIRQICVDYGGNQAEIFFLGFQEYSMIRVQWGME